MATPATIAMVTPEGWHGTTVTYDGVPEHIVPLLLGVILDHHGDLDAAFREITAARHGWWSLLENPRDDARWESGGTYAHVVTHDNADFAMDTACWYLIDPRARTIEVRGIDGPIESFQLGPDGIATRDPDVEPHHHRNRRQDYGSDAPERSEALVRAFFTEGLDGRYASLSLIRPHGWAARARAVLSGPPVRSDGRGLTAPMRLVTWNEAGDARTVRAIVEATVAFPHRLLSSAAHTEAFLDGIRRGFARAAALPKVQHYDRSGWWPVLLLDLALPPAALAARVERSVIRSLQPDALSDS